MAGRNNKTLKNAARPLKSNSISACDNCRRTHGRRGACDRGLPCSICQSIPELRGTCTYTPQKKRGPKKVTKSANKTVRARPMRKTAVVAPNPPTVHAASRKGSVTRKNIKTLKVDVPAPIATRVKPVDIELLNNEDDDGEMPLKRASESSDTVVLPLIDAPITTDASIAKPLAGEQSGYYIYVSNPDADVVPSSPHRSGDDRTYSESVASSGHSPALEHLLDFGEPSTAMNVLEAPGLQVEGDKLSPEPVLTGLESPSYRAKVLGEQYSPNANAFSSEFMEEDDDLFAVYRDYRNVPDMTAF